MTAPITTELTDTPAAPTAPGPRWLRWRDAALASPRFHRWAARLPLLRRIARRRASALHAITAGFVFSQTLLALVELELLPLLRGRSRTVRELADACNLDPEALLRLLRAGSGIGILVERGDGSWRLGELGAAMLGNPGVAAMVGHHRRLYDDLRDPVALLRDRSHTQLRSYWPYAGRDADDAVASAAPTATARRDIARYSALMRDSQAMIADQILDAAPLHDRRHLLDIAGGTGAFAETAARRHPRLQVSVVDLPEVVNLARSSNTANPRIAFTPADMFRDPLPAGADAASLIRVLHDHDDDAVAALLARIHAALAPGAQLLVAEPMADTPGEAAIGQTYFGLYLWAMGSGRPRSAGELSRMLRAAGFTRVRERATHLPLLARVLIAERH